jgi:hypothetical protein
MPASLKQIKKSSVRDRVSKQEWQVRVDLAAAYQLAAIFKWTDLIYTHFSARVPGSEDFLINAYGLMFDEITASSLVKIDKDGNVIDDSTGLGINYAGFVMSLLKNISAMTSEIHVETISPKRLFDRISAELARLNVARYRTLVKIDCEYKELTIVSDVLSYISQHEQWSDFLLVAETGGGGTFVLSVSTPLRSWVSAKPAGAVCAAACETASPENDANAPADNCMDSRREIFMGQFLHADGCWNAGRSWRRN